METGIPGFLFDGNLTDEEKKRARQQFSKQLENEEEDEPLFSWENEERKEGQLPFGD